MQVDRRRKPRLEYTLPIRVAGVEAGGKPYRFETVLRDIGAGGLCAFATRKMTIGEKLSLYVRFARPGSRALQAAEVAVQGHIVRTEESPTGLCRFAVAFL